MRAFTAAVARDLRRTAAPEMARVELMLASVSEVSDSTVDADTEARPGLPRGDTGIAVAICQDTTPHKWARLAVTPR